MWANNNDRVHQEIKEHDIHKEKTLSNFQLGA